MATIDAAPSAWSPFRHRAFALLWTATLISNIGTWMHDVGAGWLMATLSPSPAVVALVQAATTAPVFLLALFAGALADRLDRRRMLIVINLLMAGVIAALAALTAMGAMTPILLVAFTLVLGTGAAFMAPAWQAVVPTLVPREALQPAIALNSMGINVSRAIGPALAGLLIASVGIAAPFVLNALSHLVIIAALLAWRPPATKARALPPEPLLGAMATGLRHARHNDALKATLIRSAAFFAFASALWAFLPLLARGIEGGGAEFFGLLLTSVGAGAVAGALGLPALRRRLDGDRVAWIGTAATGAAMLGLAVAGTPPLALAAAGLGGMGWIAVLTSLNVSAQTALPGWVRARGLAISLMVFFGCMALGAVIWGQIAQHVGIPATLGLATAGLALAALTTRRLRLGQGEGLDLAPAMSWPEPAVADGFDAAHDRGPVLVTITYAIDEADTEAFQRAGQALSGERLRDGAMNWGLYQNAEQPRLWIEWFLLPSWAEHLRQHERATGHDHDLHAAMRAFHRGEAPPEIRHFLAPSKGRARLGDEP